jgi:hypothetical protein
MTTLEDIEKAPLPRLIQLGVTPGDVMGVFTKPRTALPHHAIEYQKALRGKYSMDFVHLQSSPRTTLWCGITVNIETSTLNSDI